MRRTFRALMVDLPLPEQVHLNVMRILADHYSAYGDLGMISTRPSGKHGIVKIDLCFPAGRTLGEISTVGGEMERALAGAVPDLVFRVVPRPGG